MMNPEYVEKKTKNDFKATEVVACRICLATDVKMYSINNKYLKDCMDLIIGLNNSNEGLPKYVCYQCAPDLKRCKTLIDKIQTSQAIFQDIFTKNGEVTQNLIKAQNRTKLNLQSPLDSYLLINYYHIQYDDGIATHVSVKNDSEENIGTALKKDPKDELSENGESLPKIIEVLNDTKTVKCNGNEENVQEINMEISEEKISSNVEKSEDNLNMNSKPVERPNGENDHQPSRKEKSKPGVQLKWKKKGKGKKFNSLFFNENMVKEQLLEWQKSALVGNKPGEKIWKCEICGKEFTDLEVHRAHINCHEKVLGSYKCKACQKHMAKFRTMTFHNELNHTKRFSCKFCPKTFNNVDDANNHTTWGKCMGNNNFKPTFVLAEEPIRPPLNEPIFWDA